MRDSVLPGAGCRATAQTGSSRMEASSVSCPHASTRHSRGANRRLLPSPLRVAGLVPADLRPARGCGHRLHGGPGPYDRRGPARLWEDRAGLRSRRGAHARSGAAGHVRRVAHAGHDERNVRARDELAHQHPGGRASEAGHPARTREEQPQRVVREAPRQGQESPRGARRRGGHGPACQPVDGAEVALDTVSRRGRHDRPGAARSPEIPTRSGAPPWAHGQGGHH